MTRYVKNKNGGDSGNTNNGGITVKGNRNNHQYQSDPTISQVAISTLLDEEQEKLEAIATGTGASDPVDLEGYGDYILTFESTGAFVLDLQVGQAGSFEDAYWDATTKITIDSSTGPQTVTVDGGNAYRMDVGTYNNPITMTAHKLED